MTYPRTRAGRAASPLVLLLLLVLVGGCSQDRPAPSPSPSASSTPKPRATATFAIPLGDYCATLEHLRDANADPGRPQDVAKALTQRLGVLEKTYRHLAGQTDDRAAQQSWTRIARDVGSAHTALEAANGDVSNEQVLLRLAVLRDTMQRELTALDPNLRTTCKITARQLAGTALNR